jgi:very-short-patch-repair endonuclease
MSRHADSLMITLAAGQQGLVTRAQLLAAGLSRHSIDRRSKSGFLRSLHAGVYLIGPVLPPRAREHAAVLACGGGVISHRSAALVREILPQSADDGIVDIVPHDRLQRGRRPGIRAHRITLRHDEIATVERLTVTTPARTLLDLAPTLAARDLEQAFATAERAYPDIRARATALLLRYPRRRGTRALRALVQPGFTPAFTRSRAEEVLLALLRSGGLAQPETNVLLNGFEVDFFWRSARLVVEVDGFEFHASRPAFNADRQRDIALNSAGLRVIRLSWRQITQQRDRTLVQLAQMLARAPT